MGKFVLTGVSGNLGSVAADYLLEISAHGDQLVFTTSHLENITEESRKRWEEKGAQLVYASYDDIQSMEKAFAGAEAVALISTFFLGNARRRQHKAAIDTAKAVGVKRICYTSFIGAGLEKDLPFLPRDHKWTEQVIYDSGLEYNIQRNYLYGDNIYLYFAPSWKFTGNKWLNNSKATPAAWVVRDDCSRVAAALLLGKGEPNTVYNISGPEPVSDEEIFNYICKYTGLKAEYVTLSDEELEKYWKDVGLPDDVFGDFPDTPMKLTVPDLISSGEVPRRGLMGEVTDAVEKLTGRKPLPVLRPDLLERYKAILPRP